MEKSRRPCRVAEVKVLLGAEGDELEQLVGNESVPMTLLQSVVNNRGITLGYKSIARHRKGECGCPHG